MFQDFSVKYLGMKPARGLWGIKHTRKPVDDLVGLARGLGPGAPLPFLQLTVSARGVVLSADKANTCPTPDTGLYPIDTISYGVQDLVYTRVFAMIVVRDKARDKDKEVDPGNPFQCLAFVCDSRQTARRLTFALAAAFKVIIDFPSNLTNSHQFLSRFSPNLSSQFRQTSQNSQ